MNIKSKSEIVLKQIEEWLRGGASISAINPKYHNSFSIDGQIRGLKITCKKPVEPGDEWKHEE